MAFEEERSRDPLVIEAGQNEGIFLASFDMDALRKYRAYECWGDTYRKPAAYTGLVDHPISDTFIRKDSRR